MTSTNLDPSLCARLAPGTGGLGVGRGGLALGDPATTCQEEAVEGGGTPAVLQGVSGSRTQSSACSRKLLGAWGGSHISRKTRVHGCLFFLTVDTEVLFH